MIYESAGIEPFSSSEMLEFPLVLFDE